MKMFSVYDSKAEAFKTPFFMKTKGEAIRAWKSAANDKNIEIGKYPSDFTLFEIASYDEETGDITQHEAKISLGTAIEFVEETH